MASITSKFPVAATAISRMITENSKLLLEKANLKSLTDKITICSENSCSDRKKAKISTKNDCEYSIAKASDTENVIQFLTRNYLQEEPLMRGLGISKRLDPLLERIIREDLSHGFSVLALRPKTDREIIGVCVNEKCPPWEASALKCMSTEAKTGKVQNLLQIWALLCQEPKMHEKLKQNEIFGIDFLSVCKNHWRKGIGEELAIKSLSLGRDLNFNYARMICTNDDSRRLAERLGMTEWMKIPYDKILIEGSEKPVVSMSKPHTHASVYYVNLKLLSDDFFPIGLH